MIRSAIFALSMLTALTAPAYASGLTAQQTVHKLVEAKAENGEVETELVEADLVAPGETVVYMLNYTNDSVDAADNVVLTMPVPAELLYLENSATIKDKTVSFSADGGETYTSRGDLTVIVAGEPREAVADDITHIRWAFTDSIAPQETGTIQFKAVLK